MNHRRPPGLGASSSDEDDGFGASFGNLLVQILSDMRILTASTTLSAIVSTSAPSASSPAAGGEVGGEGAQQPPQEGGEGAGGRGGGTVRRVFILVGGAPGLLGDFATSDSDFEQILTRLAALHQPQGPPPATQAALDALPTICVEDSHLAESPRCPICCESFLLGAEACQLPCEHIFDKVCVLEWLTKHNTCPICRYELPVEDSEKEQDRKQRMAARGIDEDAFFAQAAHRQSIPQGEAERADESSEKASDEPVRYARKRCRTAEDSKGSETSERPNKRRRKQPENDQQDEKRKERERKRCAVDSKDEPNEDSSDKKEKRDQTTTRVRWARRTRHEAA